MNKKKKKKEGITDQKVRKQISQEVKPSNILKKEEKNIVTKKKQHTNHFEL